MAQKFLNGVHISGATQLDFMPTHESEGIITLGRYDSNTSRYHNIKSFVSSTEASNYLKFSLHNGSANTVADVLHLKGNGYVGIGKAVPSFKLHVDSAENGETAIGVSNTGSGASRVYLDASNGDFSGSDYMWIGQNNDLSGEIFMAQSAGGFHIKTQPGGTTTSQFSIIDLTKMKINYDGTRAVESRLLQVMLEYKKIHQYLN